MEISGAIIWK